MRNRTLLLSLLMLVASLGTMAQENTIVAKFFDGSGGYQVGDKIYLYIRPADGKTCTVTGAEPVEGDSVHYTLTDLTVTIAGDAAYVHFCSSQLYEYDAITDLQLNSTALNNLYVETYLGKSLDLSHVPNLWRLDAAYSNLESLDFSQCPKLYTAWLYQSQIKEEAMTRLVNSLPQWSWQEHSQTGSIYLLLDGRERYGGNYPPTNGMPTKEAIKGANAKGWDLIMFKGDGWQSIKPEDGTTGINSISLADQGNDEWYDLSGRRVPDTARGVLIHKGKKVIRR